VAQRKAFDAATVTHYSQAQRCIQDLLNADTEIDGTTRGWLMWQLAEYQQYTNAVEAEKTLKAALNYNRRLTRPLDGIEYERLSARDMEQSRNAAWKVRSYGVSANKMLIDVNAILEDLIFKPETSKPFEEAIREIAEVIGFNSQRPETENSGGPDGLWAVGNLRYFVIECKNGAVASKVSKDDANQLAGAINWFEQRYDNTCVRTPILVHPSYTAEFDASPDPDIRVMTAEGLLGFKDAVRAYAKAASSKASTIDAKEALAILDHHRLTPDKFLQAFTKPIRSGR